MTGSDDGPGRLADGQLDVLIPGADGSSPPPVTGLAEAGAARLATWRDVSRPAQERVADLLRRMTLAEKVGQLRSTWPGSTPDGSASPPADGSGGVAPLQEEMDGGAADWPDLIRDGLGQLTRPFGTRPVTAREGADALARAQRQIVAAGRFGIPAIAHDECLAGFTAWTAAIFPVPLAWGASFDPPLVEQMAAQIGTSMRAVGVHQGLAPVLDVTVDPRWGRTEETIGEDPSAPGERTSSWPSASRPGPSSLPVMWLLSVGRPARRARGNAGREDLLSGAPHAAARCWT